MCDIKEIQERAPYIMGASITFDGRSLGQGVESASIIQVVSTKSLSEFDQWDVCRQLGFDMKFRSGGTVASICCRANLFVTILKVY